MAHAKHFMSEVELNQAFTDVCEVARTSGRLPVDLPLEKLLPLFCRIASDLHLQSLSVNQSANAEIAALDTGILWARTSHLIPLRFDCAYLLARVTQKYFSSSEGQLLCHAPEDSPGIDHENCAWWDDESLVDLYFQSFFLALSKEWMRLDTLPYHKKLREANRFILQEKRRYYTIFNRMSEPAFIVDQELHILETNKAFNRFFQLSGKNHIGLPCRDVLGEEFCVLCRLENVLDTHRASSGIETEVVVNGQCRHLVLTGTFLGEINSDFSGGIIILQDVTQSRNAEAALRKSERQYRSLIENVPDITWRSDQDGVLSYVSPNIQNICGYEPDIFYGSDSYDKFSLIHPDDVDMVRNEYGLFFASNLPDGSFLRRLLRDSSQTLSDDRILNGRKKYDVTYRFRRSDGNWMWVHDRSSIVYEKNGGWYTDGVLSDVTELKEAEAELERHHFRLAELVDERTIELRNVNKNLKNEISYRKQAEKNLLQLAAKLSESNKELEQFAHVASHDLKEPLILITAFSQRLLKKYLPSLDERGQDYLKRIVKAANQMAELIDGLLALSRITSAEQKFEKIDLVDLVEEVIGTLEERIRETEGSIEFGVQGCLDGDRVQLRQLFQNIIANSLKFRKKGEPPKIKVSSCFIDEDLCEIRFSDDGIGFEPSHGERIFRPLERLNAKKEYEGTGMGLATCQKIVVRHGGQIEAKGELGKGAVFIIRLPVVRHSNDKTNE